MKISTVCGCNSASVTNKKAVAKEPRTVTLLWGKEYLVGLHFRAQPRGGP